jgi:uncharacterized protein (DUF433 family)
MVYRGETKSIQCNTVYTGFMQYVDERNGGFYVAGSRVSLDSVVYAYLRGESSIGIAESFTSLSLDQINGAIKYYLANRADVDAYLKCQEIKFEQMRRESRAKDPAFYAKMDAARKDFAARRR